MLQGYTYTITKMILSDIYLIYNSNFLRKLELIFWIKIIITLASLSEEHLRQNALLCKMAPFFSSQAL